MKTKDCPKGIAELYPYIKNEWRLEIEKKPKELLKKTTELRFRLGKGCSLTCGESNYLIENIAVTARDMEELLEHICRGAAYQFETQMENGYIPLPGGHRAGLCGTYVTDEKGMIRIRDLSSINFRICREIKGIAENLFPKLLCDDRFCSTLIVSEPCGGKTTLLSDLVRVLSEKGYRSAVIDERGEIAASYRGLPQKDLGALADVMDGYPKPYGMMVALRTMSPQVLVCDEIGTAEETEQMLEAMNAGVPVLATAHAKDEEELFNRPQIRRLLDAGAISKIVLLKGARAPGKIRKVMTVNHYDDEDFWSSTDC
ncbi:MAG: stage III sporulation protein AA [Clostridia bacterium]|nr:stage III sporulation protein AA [Clostridia bacterium]